MELTKTADAPAGSPFSALITMFYEPGKTFAALEHRKAGWLPMILLMASSLIITGWYFSVVDFQWLLDQMFAAMPATDVEAAKSFMSKGMMMTMSIVSTLVVLPAVLAFMALYFLLASKSIKKPIDFNTAFSLSAWTSLPMLLTLPLGAIQILMMTNGQLTFSQLNPLSLNQLFFHYEMSHKMASFMDSLSVFTIWNIVLLVIGFEAWAKVKRSTSVLVVLVPYVTIYGLWFAFALAMSKAT